MKQFACAGAVIAGILATPAHAVVVSGEVTGGSSFANGGVFVKLEPGFTESMPDNTVGRNTFQSDNLYAFDEDQNIVAPSEIAVDIGTNIPAGQVVASHYIAYDPLEQNTVVGRVTFDAPVIGIAVERATLAATDFLANTGVDYLSPEFRGLERIDLVTIDPSDAFSVLINLRASSPGDYVRVFTEFSPSAEVPLPASLWLFTAGVAGLAGMRRTRR